MKKHFKRIQSKVVKNDHGSEVITEKPEISPFRKNVFRILTLLFPVFLIFIVEVIFRFSGWGGYPSFLKPVGILESGDTLIIVEPAASKPYFYSNPSRPGYAEQYNFVMPKPKNTIRIFLLGESAAKGYPQPKNLSMSSFLQAMLSDLFPGKKIEVINLGTTAVASFPITFIAKEALKYNPDFIISYTGNNEFFGSYGTASINSSGALSPAFLNVIRWFNGLATIQAYYHYTESKPGKDITLMEQMIGETVIPSDSDLRESAAANLKYNLGEIAESCNEAGVPLILCTTASNESSLYPLGSEDMNSLGEKKKIEFENLLTQGVKNLDSNSLHAVTLLRRATEIFPEHAGATFLLGRAYLGTGDIKTAKKYFLKARDLDKMPWRPITLTEQAIRGVALNHKLPLCDIAEEFRRLSTDGATGWDFMDDHVHLSLRGQAEAARLMTNIILKNLEKQGLTAHSIDSLKTWEEYAKNLGSNEYDQYRVAHTMRVLFNVPFLKKNNGDAFNRYLNYILTAESKMSKGVLGAVREWQTETPHAGGQMPITGLVAKAMVKENRLEEALKYFEIARTQVPEYTSWFLEYVYFSIALKASLNKTVDNSELDDALMAIGQGKFLLKNGYSETGLTERYMGRLHQLREEWDQAIPYLFEAVKRLKEEDLVAADQALYLSYIKTGKTNEALILVENGIRRGGKFVGVYEKLRKSLANKK